MERPCLSLYVEHNPGVVLAELSQMKLLLSLLILSFISGTLRAESISKSASEELADSPAYRKTLENLQKPLKISMGDFGPGVTGGGDRCEQRVAYSFAFLTKLFAEGKIDLRQYGVDQKRALKVLDKMSFAFGQDLKKGRPVEMINLPPKYLVVLDHKICDDSAEALDAYSDILLHEAMRLMGINDAGYKVSIDYHYILDLATPSATAASFNGSSFQVLDSLEYGNLALAWGIENATIDFNALSEKTPDEQWKFYEMNKEHLVNYLVELRNMKILTVIREYREGDPHPPINGFERSASQPVTNQLDLLFDGNVGVVVAADDHAWISHSEAFFEIKLDKHHRITLADVCKKNCDAIIQEAVDPFLSAKQKAQLASKSLHNYSYQRVRTGEDNEYGWEVKLWAVDKGDLHITYYTAPISLYFLEGLLKPKVLGAFKESGY